ncbi:MAG: DUF2333 family protein [Desulfococcaceae bacterium]|jgi:hypothetical protein|nr:DUF2333 family protein [Desulfococcaceae bacterium]
MKSLKTGTPAFKRLLWGGLAVIVLLACVWTVAGFMGGPKTAANNNAHGTEKLSKQSSDKAAKDTAHSTVKKNASAESSTRSPKDKSEHTPAVPQTFVPSDSNPPGIAFVEACIRPMNNELNERFWGWRPNDIINVTDNVNSFQLGVLEVTRRTSVALAENISRTGSTDAYVPALELAMNWFMVKPSQYWFPSAESKYQEGLEELKNYMDMLRKKEARFYRRVDNLVPLFKSYESILGSCDENLVKGLGELSFFKSDDYFYYTQGVAAAMGTILEAASFEFHELIASVQCTDVMHHAITSLKHASHMHPWIILESRPDSLLANHRANMAAPISHARFYLSVLNIALTGNI